MIYTLKNEFLEITASSFGGELHSIKNIKNNKDYLWSADEKFWARHAPVLFPTVGKSTDNSLMVDDNVYPITSHGFARDMEFTLSSKTDNSLTFTLQYNEETLKKYPYKFLLNIVYTLDMNTVLVKYIVENKDKKDIFFSIGAHPAFNCPINSNENYEDYYLEFSDNETLALIPLSSDGYFKRERTPYLKNEKIINLSKSLFDNDALVFENHKSKTISIKSKKFENSVTVNIEGFPFLGIWAKKDSPFVCIEPWFGHADFVDFKDDIKNKEGIQRLKTYETFTCVHSYTIK